MIGLMYKTGLGYNRQDWDDILQESEGIDSTDYTKDELKQAITTALETGNLTNYIKSVYPDFFEAPYFQLGWWDTENNTEYYKEIWTI